MPRTTRSSNAMKQPQGIEVPQRRSAADVQATREQEKQVKAEEKERQKLQREAAKEQQRLEREAAKEKQRLEREAAKEELVRQKVAVKEKQVREREAVKKEQARARLAAKEKQAEEKAAKAQKSHKKPSSEVDDEGSKISESDDKGSLLTDLESGVSENDRPKKKAKKANFKMRTMIKDIRQQPARPAAAEPSDDSSRSEGDDDKTPVKQEVSRGRRRTDLPASGERISSQKNSEPTTGTVKNWATNLSTWGTQPKALSHARSSTSAVARSKPPISFEKELSHSPEPKSKHELNAINLHGYLGNEDEGIERFAALSSPIKGPGNRVTNNDLVKMKDTNADVIELSDEPTPKPRRMRTTQTSMVKIEDVDSDAQRLVKKEKVTKGKARALVEAMVVDSDGEELKHDLKPKIKVAAPESKTSKPNFTNADLPHGAVSGNRWRGTFIPTFARYVGSLEDPWNFDDAEIVRVLQLIWDTVYQSPEVKYTVKKDGPVFSLADQRMSEYRAGFGSSALTHVENFFKQMEDLKCSPHERQIFATTVLTNNCFAFEDTIKLTGLFRSPPILETLAWHYTYIKNAINVPGLYEDDQNIGIVGAVGLSAAAVERILILWMTGDILLHDDGPPTIPLKLNPSTGKKSNYSTNFGDATYGSQTRAYAVSAQNLPVKRMAKLVRLARNIANSTPNPHVVSIASEETSSNNRANLVDAGSDSD
ncbi:hypothetical protein SCP_1301720 [Sparassis crispa]|uniref:Uncharacterized protein n=1 Tax=Sparassis crispa TaxID=139825 RepID=A0A401H1P1_9APHY|nr:hypothetical protein SCP_1301720 [Sparassis crispa]GBE88357.1 hypothetical protein SCP_1301720 [Sparassis crispa]